MCGIFGIINYKNSKKELNALLTETLKLLKHRGPDDCGMEIIESKGQAVALAHTRLSIIDLSRKGKQPMWSHDRSLCIIYNGEIYNYIELRKELERKRYRFTSATDTEVILAAYSTWGTECFARFNGMWALLILDLKRNEIIISRDRLGIKPLYYTQSVKPSLLFSSEIKPLLNFLLKNKITPSPNDIVIHDYLVQNLINNRDESWYNEVKIFPAGTWSKINLTSAEPVFTNPQSFWSPLEEGELFSGNVNDEIEYFKELFTDSVKIRLRSDVRVATLLSGGIDSSAITSVALENGNTSILSSVSEDPEYDESRFIDIFAAYKNVKPIKSINKSNPGRELMEALSEALRINEQPFNSFSVLSYMNLMKKASDSGLKVILSGQGADEILCGYKKYYPFYLYLLFRQNQWKSFTSETFHFMRHWFGQFKLAEAKRYMPFIPDPLNNIIGEKLMERESVSLGSTGTLRERQLGDLKKYSVPSLVHYEDRMSMQYGREVRLPFLDHRLISFSLKLNDDRKLKNGWTKHILRQAMIGSLPDEIVWRRDKQGFLTPQEKWLKHNFSGYLNEIFNSDLMAAKMGYLNKKELIKYHIAFKKGNKRIWHGDVLRLLLLELWLRSSF